MPSIEQSRLLVEFYREAKDCERADRIEYLAGSVKEAVALDALFYLSS